MPIAFAELLFANSIPGGHASGSYARLSTRLPEHLFEATSSTVRREGANTFERSQDQPLWKVGELEVAALAAVSSHSSIRFEIFLTRDFSSYMADYSISICLVLAALASVFVHFDEELLVSRATLILTLLLMLIIIAQNKNPMVANVPVLVLQDKVDQAMVVVCALVGLESVLVATQCVEHAALLPCIKER